MKHILTAFLILFLFSDLNCFAFSFKKKQPPPKEKMVQTKQEWLEQAKSVPLEERKLPEYQPAKSDKKHFYPEPHYVFEKFNISAGSRDVNIADIKSKLVEIPYIVADLKFNYVAYPRYYFQSEYNQISSDFFVEKLDTSLNRKDRLLNYIHNQKTRKPVLQVGNNLLYKNLYNGLSLVDWSKDSKKVLIKEKIGSLENGIYKTAMYVYFLPDADEEAYVIRLDNFEKALKYYFVSRRKIQIVKYRYDIIPLGFSADDDNVVLAYCYALSDENEKVFLGIWAYNLKTYETMLVSKTLIPLNISSNGVFVKKVLD